MWRGMELPMRKLVSSSLKLLQFQRSRLYVSPVNRGDTSTRKSSNIAPQGRTKYASSHVNRQP